jgi:DNA-binding CsgD family transcriptional regulator
MNYSMIIKKRSTPGVLIFDLKGRFLYSNREAFKMVPELRMVLKDEKGKKIRDKISMLSKQLKEKARKKGVYENLFTYSVLNCGSKRTCSIQASFLGGMKGKKPTHILILIQDLIAKHKIDFEKVRTKFALSGRELEVLSLVCDGLANKEISSQLFISEYTVKDHMKSLLRKMEIDSRNQIISSLK